MAAPTFVGAGTGSAETTSGNIGGPVGGQLVGDFVVLQMFQDGTGTDASFVALSADKYEDLDGTNNELTHVGTFDVGSPAAGKQLIYVGRAISVDQVNMTITANAEDVYARVYIFRDVNTGTTLADVIENSTAGNAVNGAGTSNTVADTGVTTTGADRLALNFVAVNDDNAIDAFAGMTGGTWAEAVAEFASSTGTDGCIQLQTATIASAGTINGGSDGMSASDAWGVVGFALKPAASGTPHTANPSSSVALADARAHGRGLGRTDTLALTDAFARVTASFRTVPDTVALADLATLAKTIPLAINDSVSLSDSATPAKGRSVAVDDSVALTDAVALARGLGLADTLALVDARALVQGKAVADTLGLADAQALARGLAVTDSLALADEATPDLSTGAVDHEVNPDDTLALTDARAFAQGKAVTDSAALTDLLARTHAAQRAVPDTVTLTDAIAKARTLALADTLALTDNASPNITTGAQDYTVNIDDTVALADQVARGVGLVRTDSVTLTDQVVASKGAVVLVEDSLLVADLFARAAAFARAQADTLGLVDVLGRTTVTLRTVDDLVAITDLAETEVNLVTLLDAIYTGRIGEGAVGGVGAAQGDIADTVGGLAAPRSEVPTHGRFADTVSGIVEEEVTV